MYHEEPNVNNNCIDNYWEVFPPISITELITISITLFDPKWIENISDLLVLYML